MKKRINSIILTTALTLTCASEVAFSAATKKMNLPDSEISQIKQKYSKHVLKSYELVLSTNQVLLEKTRELAKNPTDANLEAAKSAWKSARSAYSTTEPFRFYGGPIDAADSGPEGLMNAWPIDESYIDYVKGNPTSGFISNKTLLPKITKETLAELNEKGGERNVATGYHAVEFLLWGQDFSTKGPGERSVNNFGNDADIQSRRSQSLIALCELLVDHSNLLVNAWKPGSTYLLAWDKEPSGEILRRILVGITSLSADEMAGERMTVAFEKNDPEHEQDCFSDFSVQDLKANETGILSIYTETGLKDLFEKINNSQAKKLFAEIQTVLDGYSKVTGPMDTAILDVKSKDRKQLKAIIPHLQKQAQIISHIVKPWAIELNVQHD